MWGMLLKPLIGVAGDTIKGFVQTKKLKSETKIAEIKAEKKRLEDIANGKIQWEQSAVDQMQGSWKDELILICLLVPAVAVFVPGWTEHIQKGFEALHSLPSYYTNLLYISCCASFGIKGASGAMKLLKK